MKRGTKVLNSVLNWKSDIRMLFKGMKYCKMKMAYGAYIGEQMHFPADLPAGRQVTQIRHDLIHVFRPKSISFFY